MTRPALILVILLAVWATAGAVLLGQLAENRERRAAEAVAAVRALVDEAQQSLGRDAAPLAAVALVVISGWLLVRPRT